MKTPKKQKVGQFQSAVDTGALAGGDGRQSERFVYPKLPVEQVSWHDAMAFIERINTRIPDVDLVLPTEAQWEYACRVGTDAATDVEPMEFELENGQDNSDWLDMQNELPLVHTQPVRLRKPNSWGCHDMFDNVWEWCADDLRKYTADPVTDPIGSQDSDNRTYHGRPFLARSARPMGRYADFRNFSCDLLGFRCARVRP